LASVNRENDAAYALSGRLAGGFQGGAWRIVGPDGGPAVLKWSEARGAWAQIVLAARAKVLDGNIVNVAVPSIRLDLHASFGGVELVVAAYTVGYACLLVTGGRLGDMFGRKGLFNAGPPRSSPWKRRVSRGSGNPLVRLELFRQPGFGSGALIAALFMTVQAGCLFVLSI
jgi:MFS family permease